MVIFILIICYIVPAVNNSYIASLLLLVRCGPTRTFDLIIVVTYYVIIAPRYSLLTSLFQNHSFP